jgi:hypothetical protein
MAEKYILNFEANTSKAVKSVDKLDDSIKETTKDTQDLDNSLGGLDQASGGLITKFKGLKQGLKNVITGFKSMRVAIIATGIGALVLAVSALGAAFTNTEEGQNKFNKIMLVISSVTGNLVDILASLGDAIIDAFTNPLDAIEKFKDFIVENITNRFEAAIDTVGFLGSAIKKVFSGDFAGAMDDAKSAGSSYIDTLTGIEDTIGKTTEAVKELGEEIIKEGKIASDIADQRAKADKLERQLIVGRAEADRQRAELLEQAVDREQFTVEQRIGFLEEAGKLEEDITNKEIQAAKIRLEAKQAENALAGTTKEDLEEEARLKAQVIQLETARLTKQKEVTSQTIALKAEEAAELKAIEDQKIADKAEKDANDIEAAKILADLKIQIREAEAVSEEERRALEIEKVTEHYDKLIALAKAQGLSIVNLEKGKATALDNINKTESDNEINWAELTQKQKVDIIAKGFSDLSTILGEESAAGKAAAIASTTISTLQSAQDSYKSLSGIPIIGPALGAAAYGAALVQGFRTIKQIKATKNPVSTASEQSVSTPSITAPTTTTPQTPSFDILGTSGVNQIASALGQQAPVQAFVVSQDVTTAQSLQNNIVQGASLG